MGIVVVGSIALDTISTPKVKRQKVLGGSAVYASVALSAFVPVRLLGVIGEDYPEEGLDLLKRQGIDISGIERKAGRTFAWEGEYGDDLYEATTLATELNTFATYSPRVPESYAREELLFLGNIDPDLQAGVLSQMRSPRLVAADTIHHWLKLKMDSLKRLLPNLDVFFVNEQEAKKIAGANKVVQAAHAISRNGPRIVVIKSGEHGAVAYDREEDRFYSAPAFPTLEIVDPTGAGDSFAGGFLGSLACETDPFAPDAVKRALAVGNVLASFAISTLGPHGLAGLSKDAINQRLKTLSAMLTDGAFLADTAPVRV